MSTELYFDFMIIILLMVDDQVDGSLVGYSLVMIRATKSLMVLLVFAVLIGPDDIVWFAL
jgi:hypothetical protein